MYYSFFTLFPAFFNFILSLYILIKTGIKNKITGLFFFVSIFIGLRGIFIFLIKYYPDLLFLKLALFSLFSASMLLTLFSAYFVHIKISFMSHFIRIIAFLGMLFIIVKLNTFISSFETTSLDLFPIYGLLFLPLIVLTLILPIGYSLFLLYKGIIKEKNKNRKNAIKVIFFTIAIYASLLFVFDGLMRIHLRAVNFSFANIFSFIIPLSMFIGIKRYKIFPPTEKDIYKYIFSSIDNGIMIVDNEKKIINVNNSFEQIFNIKKEEIIGEYIEEFFKKININVCKTYENEEQKNLFSSDFCETKINKRSYFIDRHNIYKNKKVIGYVFFIKNITPQKEYERKLIEAKEEAELANKAKSDFLANITHELRTPLNGVIGMVELLSSTNLTSDQRHYLSMLHSSATLLYDLINDILDMEKIEAGKIELEEEKIDLKNLLYNILDSTYIRAARKNIELIGYIAPDVPKYIIGDSLRIRQILLNLIGNAIKFTEQGGVIIKVIKERIQNRKAILQFIIEDTGVGIPEDRVSKLFDKFVQADVTTTRKYGGTGLGLAITKHLVELMGGKIKVKSEIGKGSIFLFTLALKLPENIENTYELSENGYKKLKNMHILLYSKNRFIRNFVNDALSSWRIEVNTIDKFYSIENREDIKYYDVIILDVKNYEKDSSIIDNIKTNAKLNQSKILVFTSFESLKKVKEDRRIDAYLLKPIKQSDLFNILLQFSGFSQKRLEEREETQSEIKSNEVYSVLVVDDNDINRTLMVDLLELSPWFIEVDTAKNGKEAVEKFKKQKYDLIFMDIQMPEMSGIEATKIIRKLEKEKEIYTPIIALTAFSFKNEIKEFLLAGMNEYLSKPISREKLYSTIKKFFKINHEKKLVQKKNVSSKKNYRILNMSELKEEIEDMETLKKLIDTLMSGFIKDLKMLEEAINKKNISDIKDLTHKLKGTVSKFSTVLFNLLTDIELSASTGDFKNILSLFSELKEKGDLFLKEGKDFLKT